MSLGVLSIVGFAAKLLAVLPVAEAQTTTATCLSKFNWMDNSRNQSPCQVAAYAQGACNGGQFTVDPLEQDQHYTGPHADQVNPCQCCTVVYSLVSACAVCQNRTIETWSAWRFNCSSASVSLSQFPEQIPSGTSIPDWAYLDVVALDVFSPTAAQADNSAPESSGASSQTTATITSSGGFTTSEANPFTSTSTSGGDGPGSSGASKKSSHAGAIAGGVVGGLVGLGLIAGLIVFLLTRHPRNNRAPSAAYGNAYNGNAPLNSPPPMSQHSYSNQSPRLYDPSDPSTYPQTPPTPTIQTTRSGPVPQPYGNQQYNPGQYSGVPEL